MVRRRLATALVALTAGIGTAVCSPVSASAAQPTSGAKYEFDGTGSLLLTSFRVSRDGTELHDILIMLSMPCTNGRDAIGFFVGFAEEPAAELELASDGTFSGMFTVGELLINPFAVSEDYWLSGRFVRRGKAARVTVRSRHVGEAGTVCESKELRGTARRERPAHRG